MNTVFVRCEGPLQSWGERARWTIRDTAAEPTKSGIVGLLGCALGLRREEEEELTALSRRLRMGVRCDREGVLLRDYHTVVGGAMAAEGRIKRNQSTKEPETVVSQRYYLCDASFLVALQSDPSTIAALCDALAAPVWAPFLGRRSCPPTSPLFAGAGDHAGLEAALLAGPGVEVLAGKQVRLVLEVPSGAAVTRRDEVVSLSARRYAYRHVEERLVAVPGVAA